ncbi:MAG: YggU family protein [Anaerolineales bacterium]|nr:MAG: YggU family protein [Anaerolineales bacterium]
MTKRKSPKGSDFRNSKTGAAITVRVIPRASKNEIVDILQDGTIKIRLSSPPVDGRANHALIEFLADLLDVSRSRIEIVAGTKSRNKLVTILDMDAITVEKQILSKFHGD